MQAIEVMQSLNTKVEQLSSEVKTLKRRVREEDQEQQGSGRTSKRPFRPSPSPLGLAPQLVRDEKEGYSWANGLSPGARHCSSPQNLRTITSPLPAHPVAAAGHAGACSAAGAQPL